MFLRTKTRHNCALLFGRNWQANKSIMASNWTTRASERSPIDCFGTPFWHLWAHFWRPGRVLGTTLGHPGTQTLKKCQNDHFFGPHFGVAFWMFSHLLQFGSPAEHVFQRCSIQIWTLWNPKLRKKWCRQPSRKTPTILTKHLRFLFLWKGRRRANTVKKHIQNDDFCIA